MTTEPKDLYTRVTEQIVAAIEAGAGTWRMPWHRSGERAGLPLNAITRIPYRGINVLSLWLAAEKRRYETGVWATYKQWQERGAQVRRGERGTLLVYWKVSQREADTERDEEGEESHERRFLARNFSVFNAAQVEGYTQETRPVLSEAERIAAADEFFVRLDADIRHGGDEAYYSPTTDHVQMPFSFAFRDAASYNAVLAHEIVHWSGSEKRLARELGTRFGSEAYAAEELIAELGAAFLCAGLGIDSEPRPDHASYIDSWLRILRGDKRAIFTAATKAQQAVDWMNER